MSAELAVIPDSITPVEGWRRWHYHDGTLRSMNNAAVEWKPGQPLHAECHAAGVSVTYRWTLARGGISREKAAEVTLHDQQRRILQRQMWSVGGSASMAGFYRGGVPDPPTVTPPAGYGFELLTETHAAPDGNCRCGIYAGAALKDCPTQGDVYGKVKGWGVVVPGEKGWRAEYAYPAELHVPASLLDDEGLLAYGVPVVEATDAIQPSLGGLGAFVTTNSSGSSNNLMWTAAASKPSNKLRWAYRVSIAFNLAAVAANVAAMVAR